MRKWANILTLRIMTGLTPSVNAGSLEGGGRRRRRPLLVVIGVVLLAAGIAVAAVYLTKEVGPGGLCGSVIDQKGAGFRPCSDDFQTNGILAGTIGGAFALVGLILLAVGLIGSVDR